MRTVTSFVILIGVWLSIAACASDWPQFRGPSANGISPDKGINKNWGQKPPKMLWQTPMGDDGYAGPSVAGGKVFIIDHKGKESDVVRAVDITTGKDVWHYSYPDTQGPNYGFSRATPAIDAGKVYVFGRMGLLTCLDAKTGKKVWSRDTFADFKGKKPGWLYAMSPVVDGNQVIVSPGGPDAGMVALNKVNGSTIWQGGGSDISAYATPIIATINGKRQYVVFTGVSMIGVDSKTGAVLWRQPWKTSYDINGAAAIVLGESVFLTSGYGHGSGLVEILPAGPKVKWESKDMPCRFSSPILLGGLVYGVGEPGELNCMDPITGKVMWKQPGFEFGGLVSADGVLMALDGKSGDLVMVKPASDSYQEMGRFAPLGGQSWTAPIISDGKLIVRNKSTLACFSLK